MMGQAAGTAAAIAKEHGTSPRGVYDNHIHELQQALLKDGCFLPGIENNDRNDLALRAKVTTSSFLKGMEPEKVNNGWNRIVARDRNAWAPDPNASLPQWIQLELDKPSPLNTLHVSFEDAKDLAVSFDVEIKGPRYWKQVAQVTDNQLRRRIITFEPVSTDNIRLLITKTKTPFAICEVRLYNEPSQGKRPRKLENPRK
jgi:hypothetical protein